VCNLLIPLANYWQLRKICKHQLVLFVIVPVGVNHPLFICGVGALHFFVKVWVGANSILGKEAKTWPKT